MLLGVKPCLVAVEALVKLASAQPLRHMRNLPPSPPLPVNQLRGRTAPLALPCRHLLWLLSCRRPWTLFCNGLKPSRRSPRLHAPAVSSSPAAVAPSPPASAISVPASSIPAASALMTAVAPTGPSVPVPEKLKQRILRGEFVEFEELLSDVIGQQPEDVVQVAVTSGRPLELIQSRKPSGTKRRVCDLPTWLEAWTMYFRVIVHASPERTLELLSYQANIIEANNAYTTESWLQYDRRFRLTLALAGGTRRFDTIDPHLWQSSFTSKGRPACVRCSLTHPPPGPGCPFRPGPPSSAGGGWAGNSNTDSCGRQAAAPTGPRPVCRNFNSGKCDNTHCPRRHICSSCNGKHPASNCTKA